MIYLIALATCAFLGFLAIRYIFKGTFPLYLGICLGTALGLGIVGQVIFYIQLLGNNFNHFLPPAIALILLGILIFLNRPITAPHLSFPKNWSLLLLVALAIPLWLEANYYPAGGWDAWSCWNLKAKFIYLGNEHWKDMLHPSLWRSNNHYPLALPSINVWFWQWSGFTPLIPMFNTILFTLLTAGVLLFGLQESKVSLKVSALITLAVFTFGLGNTLSISQYSDMLSSLYMLSACVCYLLSVEKNDERWLILTGLFIGLLSFTKNEGLVAAGVLTLLMLIFKSKKPLFLISAVLIASLPTVIFTLLMAPHNTAFINGLLSIDKPSTMERLQFILMYPWIELIGGHWGGLWIVALVGLGIAGKQALKRPILVIGLFVTLYLAIVLAYYQVNTFFEIQWWMQNTLNRILFALMPVVFLWMGISLFRLKKDA